jgi:hypothetical protein
LREQD